MVLVALILTPVLVYFLYWASQPSTRKYTFDTVIASTRHEVFDYLRELTNLQHYHPTFDRVTDVKTDDKATRTCVVEEDLGIMGRHRIPLTLTSYPTAIFPSTPAVQFAFKTSIVVVTLNLVISDHKDDSHPDKSQVEVSLVVKSHKILTLVMAGKVRNIWVDALTRAKTILENDKTK